MPAAKVPLELLPVERVKLKLGGTTPLAARMTEKNPPASEIRVELSEPPKGITVEKVTPEGPGLVVSLATDAKTVEPGLKGNLIFEVFREWTPAPTEATARAEAAAPVVRHPAGHPLRSGGASAAEVNWGSRRFVVYPTSRVRGTIW